VGYKTLKFGSEGVAVIKMQDESGANVGNWTIHWSDLSKWVRQMERKFGINRKNLPDRDLDWMKYLDWMR